MEVYHVLVFQRGETEGKTLFVAAIAENHNVAAHKVITSDVRIEKDKIEFMMVLNNEQIQSHAEEIQKLIGAGKKLAEKYSSLLASDTLKTAN